LPLSGGRCSLARDNGRGRGLRAQLHAEAATAPGGRWEPVDIRMPLAGLSETGDRVVPGRHPVGGESQDRDENPGGRRQHVRRHSRAGRRGRGGRGPVQGQGQKQNGRSGRVHQFEFQP